VVYLKDIAYYGIPQAITWTKTAITAEIKTISIEGVRHNK